MGEGEVISFGAGRFQASQRVMEGGSGGVGGGAVKTSAGTTPAGCHCAMGGYWAAGCRGSNVLTTVLFSARDLEMKGSA